MADWLRKCGVCCLGLAMFLGLSFGGSTNATAGALLFTQNSWVEAPDSPSLNYPGSFTMEAWINFTGYGTCCWNSVIAKQFSHPTENGSFSLMFSNHQADPNSHDTIVANFADNTNTQGTISFIDAIPLMNGQWHHLAAVFDIGASETRLYIDGILAGTGTRSIPINITPFPVTIGNQSDGSWQFIGLIDEVRLWNVARTEQEIQDSMFRELDGSETGLSAYWKFNEGQGTTAQDSSGTGNTGFFVGNPLWVDDGFPQRAAPVPEPAALTFMALGLAGIALARRRRQGTGFSR